MINTVTVVITYDFSQTAILYELCICKKEVYGKMLDFTLKCGVTFYSTHWGFDLIGYGV